MNPWPQKLHRGRSAAADDDFFGIESVDEVGDAAADAGAEREQDEIVDPLARTEKKFAQSRGVGIVLNFDIESELRLKPVAQRIVRKIRQIRRFFDHA